MSRKSCSDGNRGFTLIEALIALAVIATVLSSIGAVIATSVKGTRAIDEHLALAGTAETLLAALPARGLLKVGSQSGQLAGYRWRLDVSPLASEDAAERRRWVPLALRLRLQARGGSVLDITTVRLVRGGGG